MTAPTVLGPTFYASLSPSATVITTSAIPGFIGLAHKCPDKSSDLTSKTFRGENKFYYLKVYTF